MSEWINPRYLSNMDYAQGHKIVARIIAEVAGTIATNGIQELSKELRGGTSSYLYVQNCLVATAYNAARSYPGFNHSYCEFHNQVMAQVDTRKPVYDAWGKAGVLA